jgi:predicted RecB family nuclease
MTTPFIVTRNTPTGRFSSTMLSQRGAQKKITNNSGSVNNTYKNGTGNEFYPSPENVALNNNQTVSGAFSENTYTAIYGFFQSRGASTANAATMASITLDIAKMDGVSPWDIIIDVSKQLRIHTDYYTSLNALRSADDQQARMSSINNDKSFVSRSIKP